MNIKIIDNEKWTFEHFSGLKLTNELDYNQMMELVEKIESMHHAKHGHFGVYISSNSCTIEGTNFRSYNKHAEGIYSKETYGDTKLHAIYLSIKDFIYLV